MKNINKTREDFQFILQDFAKSLPVNNGKDEGITNYLLAIQRIITTDDFFIHSNIDKFDEFALDDEKQFTKLKSFLSYLSHTSADEWQKITCIDDTKTIFAKSILEGIALAGGIVALPVYLTIAAVSATHGAAFGMMFISTVAAFNPIMPIMIGVFFLVSAYFFAQSRFANAKLNLDAIATITQAKTQNDYFIKLGIFPPIEDGDSGNQHNDEPKSRLNDID